MQIIASCNIGFYQILQWLIVLLYRKEEMNMNGRRKLPGYQRSVEDIQPGKINELKCLLLTDWEFLEHGRYDFIDRGPHPFPVSLIYFTGRAGSPDDLLAGSVNHIDHQGAIPEGGYFHLSLV
jgi:hypothetical protein